MNPKYLDTAEGARAVEVLGVFDDEYAVVRIYRENPVSGARPKPFVVNEYELFDTREEALLNSKTTLDNNNCVARVRHYKWPAGEYYAQCSRKRGYGPSNLYCKQHAATAERERYMYASKEKIRTENSNKS